MIRIGILGLDTSHAESFPEILETIRLDSIPDVPSDGPVAITAVYDEETVRDTAYVEEYCKRWEATRFDSPEAMTAEIDMAMILAVDWNRHVELARPFLEAGIPTFIDKPIVGSADDLDILEALSEHVSLFGGSAVPYHPSFTELQHESGKRTTHVVGYNDYYYYRTHAADTLHQVVDSKWKLVEPVTRSDATVVEVTFEDGSWGTARFDGPTDESVFAALDVGDRVRTATVDATVDSLKQMYEPFLRRFVELYGDSSDVPTAQFLDAARLSLAVEAAVDTGHEIESTASALTDVDVSSDSFVDEYEPYY